MILSGKIPRILLTLCFSFFVLFTPHDPSHAGEINIRVAIYRAIARCTIAVNGAFKITDPVSATVLLEGDRLWLSELFRENDSFRLGKKHLLRGNRILVEPRRNGTLAVNGKYYRGSVTIIREGNNFSVVNTIDLEQYVSGVLYHEISDQWPLEAIKAQAVAVRSYAIYSMQKSGARDYDLTGDSYSQVYGGRDAERYRTSLAVRKTRGEILVYQNKVLPAFFHANSGGITENAAELWDINIPPLRGGVKSVYSLNLPSYKWDRNFRLKDIQEKLAVKGYQTGLIKEIKVIERNSTGRVRKLSIEDRTGKLITIDGKTFREAIGPNLIRSSLFTVTMKGWYVDISGKGWGHGVGLCQWGAYGMAKQGHNYRSILIFYYPSSELKTTVEMNL